VIEDIYTELFVGSVLAAGPIVEFPGRRIAFPLLNELERQQVNIRRFRRSVWRASKPNYAYFSRKD
jgi:hypothetical protein